MIIWDLIKKIFKRVDNLRELIEDAIAKVLEKASDSELLDKGEELILNTVIETLEAYATKKAGQNINIPAKTKQTIVKSIISGHNDLQKKIAEILKK